MQLNLTSNFAFLNSVLKRVKKRIKDEVVSCFEFAGGTLVRGHAEMIGVFVHTDESFQLSLELPLAANRRPGDPVPYQAVVKVLEMDRDSEKADGDGYYFEFMLSLVDGDSTVRHYSHHRIDLSDPDMKGAGKAFGEAIYFWLLHHTAPHRVDFEDCAEELQWSVQDPVATAPAVAPAPVVPEQALGGLFIPNAAAVLNLATEQFSPKTSRFEGIPPVQVHGVSSARHFNKEELATEKAGENAQDAAWNRYWVEGPDTILVHEVEEVEVPLATVAGTMQDSVEWLLKMGKLIADRNEATYVRMRPVYRAEPDAEGTVALRVVGGDCIYLASSNVVIVREERFMFLRSDQKFYRYLVLGIENGVVMDMLDKSDLSFWLVDHHPEIKE